MLKPEKAEKEWKTKKKEKEKKQRTNATNRKHLNNVSSLKDLYMDAQSSFIHKSKKLETTKMFAVGECETNGLFIKQNTIQQ